MEYPLAAANACLNAITTVALIGGRVAIARGNREAHKRWMLSAVCLSGVFLVCYVMHHAQHGSVKFIGPDGARGIYFLILAPHIVLAASLVVLVPKLLWHSFRGNFDAHRRTASWTWPIWMIVSVSGVIVYVMNYLLWR
ncbi:MAG TPA: DUF420 domain-containing protein [Lentisphaeria bacterium]|mgnify:CR=1 FL=1|jgi:uncharacterized membrane protein YozB (DUF420 family)|nr:DUF420 domain-containing protein [Lentisphaeria bacterium]